MADLDTPTYGKNRRSAPTRIIANSVPTVTRSGFPIAQTLTADRRRQHSNGATLALSLSAKTPVFAQKLCAILSIRTSHRLLTSIPPIFLPILNVNPVTQATGNEGTRHLDTVQIVRKA
jgi:hypothetical protein